MMNKLVFQIVIVENLECRNLKLQNMSYNDGMEHSNNIMIMPILPNIMIMPNMPNCFAKAKGRICLLVK